MQNIIFLWLQRNRGRCPQSPTRPLAGISCVKKISGFPHHCKRSTIAHPSPRGDKLCLETEAFVAFRRSFRPLAGISCVGPADATLLIAGGFRPLAGISCVCKTAQLGPVGFGPGSDRITISHSTAAGKWQLEIKIPLIFLREPLQTAMQVAAMETRFAQSADSH